MSKTTSKISVIAAVGFSCWLTAVRGNVAQSTQTRSASHDSSTAEQVYKNIQVLKGVPAEQIPGAMRFMTASLGVGCDFCHLEKMESDEKSPKQTARQMLIMTQELNKKFFSGLDVVNCYTCHKGNSEPASRPSSSPNTSSLLEPGLTESKDGAPGVDPLLAKHLAASGGDSAIGKIKTMVARGSEVSSGPGFSDEKEEVVIWRKAPNKLLKSITSARVKWKIGVDRGFAWETVGSEIREVNGEGLEDAKRAADFFRYLKIKASYPRMVILGTAKINGRSSYVAGASAVDGEQAKLYFDAESGVLLRKAVERKTILGVLPEITDFDDYREVEGVKLPFKIVEYKPPITETFQFRTVEVNLEIDDELFTAKRSR